MTNMDIDRGNDGSIDYVEYYKYDSNGNWAKTEIDYDNDGTIDDVMYNTWQLL